MISRMVRVQLVIFAVISIAGVTFVGANYLGIDDKLLNPPYVVQADFAETGGLFTNAEVTYRGVTIGRVGTLHLTKSGVIADLKIEQDRTVPSDVVAVVANRSAVGEQYVDLEPRRDGEPFLREGDTIKRPDTRLPLATDTLLVNLDRLVSSVDTEDLQTVVGELGAGFAGTGPHLQRLIDSGIELTESAAEALPETISLIQHSKTVLSTQAAEGSAIRTFARDFGKLSDQFRASDPDLRRILADGSTASAELTDLLSRTRPILPALLGNLITIGQIVEARLPGIEQTLVTFPLVMSQLDVALANAPAGFLPFAAQSSNDAPVCTEGYNTRRRPADDTSDMPANTDARCTAPSGGSQVRGSENAPRPGTR